MPIEYEAKVLDIDPQSIADRIVHCGGQDLGERLLRRFVYDLTPAQDNKWIRLRDNGTETTLTVKEIKHDGIDGTHELEITVDDFNTTNTILEQLGFHAKAYQENRRRSFILGAARLEIDTWPRIPPYLEIEAASKEQVIAIASQLGFEESELTTESTTEIYRHHGIDLTTINQLHLTDLAD